MIDRLVKRINWKTGEWEEIDFIDIDKGDIIKMYDINEDDDSETIVVGLENKVVFQTTSDAYQDATGSWRFNT